MKSNGKFLPLILATAVSAGLLLSACGSDDSSSDQSGAQDQTPQSLKSSSSKENPSGGATAPKSATDTKKNAPDDVISKRPGGPKDKPTSKASRTPKKKAQTGGVTVTPSSP